MTRGRALSPYTDKAAQIAAEKIADAAETRAGKFAIGRVAAKFTPVGLGLAAAEKILEAKDAGAAGDDDGEAVERYEKRETAKKKAEDSGDWEEGMTDAEKAILRKKKYEEDEEEAMTKAFNKKGRSE